MTVELILASGSPRRRELLAEAGYDFRVVVSPAEELHDAAMDPGELCMRNAAAKAEAVAADFPGAVVVGADTLVFLDGEPLGKPKSLAAARGMLRRLADRTHEVRTGCAICRDGETETFVVTTEVVFRAVDDEVLDGYFSRVNPLDKAGGYAVQECGEMIISEVRGSFSNVVGLPVDEVVAGLARHGVIGMRR
jgi:septum formation protein